MATSVPSTLTAFLLPYAEHYRAHGWRVEAASHGAPDDPVCVQAFDAVHHVPWTRRPGDPANVLAAPRRIRSLVRAGGFHIVHVHDPIAAFVTRFALRRLRQQSGLRVVYTAHGFHFFPGNAWQRNLVFGGLERVAAAWTDALVVINEEDERAAMRFPFDAAARVQRMPGIGVDTARYDPDLVTDEEVAAVRHELGLQPGQQLLLMVAELNPGKRHRDAIAALAASGRNDVVLAFAGEGPEANALRHQATTAGVADRVVQLGYRNDVPVLLRASFALILPSEREGLPRCIMEAACLERPVVATRIRGVRELVGPETGILADVGDVEALAAAIRFLVDHPDQGFAMGRAGRRSMRRFDLRNVLRLHDELYGRLLDDGAATASTRSSRANG